MTEEIRFNWIAFYMELANKLIPFNDNRPLLVSKIKTIFEHVGLNLPKLEKGGIVYDVDPFTVFGLFNKGITTENRLKIISGFSEEFGVSAPIPTNFDGIPVLNNQKATFYGFEGDRGEKDLDNLWDVFTSAIQFADEHTSTSKEKLIDGIMGIIGAISQKDSENKEFLSGLFNGMLVVGSIVLLCLAAPLGLRMNTSMGGL